MTDSYSDLQKEEERIEYMANRLKLLSEPMRLRILEQLRDGERCVKDLVDATGAGQANISKHLSLMTLNGMVMRRKVGLYVYYRVKDDAVFRVIDCVKKSLD